ncbi:hypothetical protein CALVIDRAFT_508488 [Calocera viscosa TUFC12733]|uniref:Serine/threonine-protein kinase Tel1 n=1 Tax=Calocera viscosa (strain TUFC12733) TaxID=1330018 RepID=A0A167SEY0_CALVF|nr:hypothetical protein CALVIDRAFT_508488 [Calocera viscosa TUFC12733]
MAPFGLHTLSHGKVTERHAELAKVRAYFERIGSNLYTEESDDYLYLYQSLFACIRQDAQVWEKKPSPAGERRLEDAGAVLRLVVEKTIHRTERKPFNALRNHVLQSSVYRKELVPPLALNYAKMLDTALAYNPHLEHLRPDEWVQLVFRCFDVLLGNKITNETPLDEDFREPDDADMDAEDHDARDGLTSPTPGPSTSNKRARVESSSSSPNAKRPRRAQRLIPMTTVQREYASVLKRLFSTSRMHLLDKVILKDHRSPDREPEGYEIMKRLQKAVLRSFTSFFSIFPGETSGTEDVLCAMNAALFDLELNAKELVTEFGLDTLPILMDVWGIKSPLTKEQLIITTRLLLPFISHQSVDSLVSHDLIAKLRRRLEEETDPRGGLEPLTLDSLRLQLADAEELPAREEEAPFRKVTFRNGHGLTKEQVVTWAAMEVHADCLSKLHEQSEVSFVGKDGERESKRLRRENPVKLFISAFESPQEPEHTRVFRLQFLLFFIDRSWSTLHEELQNLIHNQLTALVSDTHSSVQSWGLLCLAAIAACSQPKELRMDWPAVWSLALRRLSTTSTCRSACHCLHVMLKVPLLEWQRILSEIADLSRELAVQGPTFPYDSVCSFLSECLRVASRDSTLYRMQIEDKILAWLEKTWRMVEGTTSGFTTQIRLEPHTVSDTISLFSAICQLKTRVSLDTRILPPDCCMTDRLLGERSSALERDFLLSARLPFPDLVKPNDIASEPQIDKQAEPTDSVDMGSTAGGQSIDELIFPDLRQRSCSTFLQSTLDHLIQEWSSIKEPQSTTTMEQLRRMADIVTHCLAWEALLTLNGVRFTRKVIQLAACVLDFLSSVLAARSKTHVGRPESPALVLSALDPLVNARSYEGDTSKEIFLRPGAESGIRRAVLMRVTQTRSTERDSILRERSRLQGIIWRMADLQDAALSFLKLLRGYFSQATDDGIDKLGAGHDDGWDMGQHSVALQGQPLPSATLRTLPQRACAEISVAYLARVPGYQSQKESVDLDQPARDLILLGIANRTFLISRSFFRSIQSRELRFTIEDAKAILKALNEASFEYSNVRSEAFWLCVAEHLRCTLKLWLRQSTHSADAFFEFAGTAIRACQTYNFRWVPPFITEWLHVYLSSDPEESQWVLEDETARSVLEDYATHGDYRVRFHLGPYLGALFVQNQKEGQPLDYYNTLFDKLPAHADRFEEMCTRSMIMGNIMLPSSEVRKAPYWALISTCLQFDLYKEHVQNVLVLVSALLGMGSLADLFRPYAGQFAFTASQMTLQTDNMDVYDLTKLPKMFGYPDRKSLASDCFLLMGPVFLALSNDVDANGGSCFRALCTARGIQPTAGMQECLPRTLGLRIAFFMNNITLDDPSAAPNLEDIAFLNDGITRHAQLCGIEEPEPAHLVSTHIVDIVLSILTLLVDTDFGSPGASVLRLLQSASQLAAKFPGSRGSKIDSPSAISTFRAFVIDIDQDYPMHRPILPAVSSLTILRCLLWLNSHYGGAFLHETAYHVVTELFALATRASMVNEQVRALRSVMMYISLCTSCFTQLSVLRVLLRGASALIDQMDVARTSRNFLNWGLQLFLRIDKPDEILTEILLRIGRAMDGYGLRASDPASIYFNQELEAWIVQRMEELYESKVLREMVRTAVILWPSTDVDLFPFCEVSLDSVHAVLLKEQTAGDKFPLVRYVSAAAQGGIGDLSSLSAAGFWQLKAALHTSTKTDIEHSHQISNLLFSYSCRLEAVEMDTRPVPMALTRYLREVAAHRRRFRELSSAFYLVAHLSQLLTDVQAGRRAAAYATLRRVMPLIPEEVRGLSQVTQAEVSLIRTYPLELYPWRERSIQELLDPAPTQLAATYSDWIHFFTTFLVELHAPYDPIWAQAIPILQMDVSFAELLLPPLVHAVLKREVLVDGIEHRSIRTLISAYFQRLLEQQGITSTACTLAIIDVIIYLRNFEVDEKVDPLSHDKWLDLDFGLLSKCAAASGAYKTALMLHEMMADSPDKHAQNVSDEEVLYAVYSHIEEPDGFYAIKARDARTSVVRSVEHEGRWDLALGFHGSGSRTGFSKPGTGSEDSALGIVRSLKSLGFDYLAVSFLNSLDKRIALPDLEYDLAWRTDSWDLPNIRHESTNTNAALYMALQAVHRERRPEQANAVMNDAFVQTVQHLKVIPDDDMVGLLKACTTLVCLREVLHWLEPCFQIALKSEEVPAADVEELLKIPTDMDFSVTESTVATRVSLLRAVQTADATEQIGNLRTSFSQRLRAIERDCLLGLSEAARKSGKVQVALNAVTQAQQLQTTQISNIATSTEFANVLWAQGEKKSAIDALSALLQDQLDSYPDFQQMSDSDKAKIAALEAHLGWWISEAGLDEGRNINDQYFQPAIELLGKTSGPISSDHASVFYRYALFADEQYQTIGTRDLSRYELYIRRKEQELAWFEAQGYDAAVRRVQEARIAKIKPRPNDTNLIHKYRTHRDRANTLLQRDQARYAELVLAGKLFLRKAIEMFSKVLSFSDIHDENAAVRLLARWFSQFKDDDLNNVIGPDLERVPSHKFVFLVHQLSARMDRTPSLPGGQRNLQSLMLRICKEHPFHSLYQVYALGGLKRSRMAAAQADEGSQQGRIDAAAFIYHALSVDASSGGRIKHVFEACEAYLEWANYPMKAQKPDQGKNHAMPARLRILQLVNYDIPVATVHTSVDKTMMYRDIVTIQQYDKVFKVAGGNNCPKISTCIGSDGRRYHQLFKGEGGDDLRQDAVMEQVFELVNNLLRHDLHTTKRRLQVRTYRVIPLASQAGMLEFVENTSPLGTWLQAAHLRYNKGEPPTNKIRERLPAPEAQIPPDRKYKFFDEICKRVRPVMRHYFTEKRKIPAAWFAMRLRYARSVAVTSIVGHILGLGDRHLSNILIDNQTGEVVHIDLGIAFEQGTLLPIPETVPFRLTRDIVDGLGTCGTDGVFQRCAENTLRVLREESDHIKTILEVFRYDPLHSWTASPFQIAKAQAIEVTPPSTGMPPSTAGSEFAPSVSLASKPSEGDVTEELNMESDMAQENADRALKSVADKLDKSLSVEYTVNRLINEARDMWNLSQIYSGWLPWY